jgi:hypothetical protein
MSVPVWIWPSALAVPTVLYGGKTRPGVVRPRGQVHRTGAVGGADKLLCTGGESVITGAGQARARLPGPDSIECHARSRVSIAGRRVPGTVDRNKAGERAGLALRVLGIGANRGAAMFSDSSVCMVVNRIGTSAADPVAGLRAPSAYPAARNPLS